MLLLLPPSEAKAPGGDGPPVAVDAMVAPRLAAVRSRVLRAVATLAADPVVAAAALKLPPAVALEALQADRTALDSPTLPALERYRGVVYEGLGVDTMTPGVRAVADGACLIFSGLFGLVGGADRVPDYRVPVSAVLPSLGALTPVWRAALRDAMPRVLGRGFAVDLRSTGYAGMWAPTGPLRHQVLSVRVLSRRPSGPPRVVSHFSKLGKGVLARALLERAATGQPVVGVDDVSAVADALGWKWTTRRVVGGVAALDVVLPD